MNKDEFLKKKYVIDFIKWIEQKLDASFDHSYNFKKGKEKDWKCNSIYNAFENYRWSINGEIKNFDECQEHLNSIKIKLKEAIENEDKQKTKEECINILKWGGVENFNKDYIENNNNIIEELKFIKSNINPSIYEINNQTIIDIKTNSGFSKIYSMLIDNFIIYDSRVSAAICLFIRRFYEERNIEIPDELLFEIPKGKGKNIRRNPSNEKYKFDEFNKDNYKHLKYNIKASWLLKGILEITKSRFNDLSENIQLRALEAAFFMIGYEV